MAEECYTKSISGGRGIMITIFNRKELAITFSMEHQATIRNILVANNIGYFVRVVNHGNSTRARTGSFGENMKFAYEYIIYVRRNDYDKAVACINRNHGL